MKEGKNMQLIISEKPSQAMVYANVLGARQRKDGYIEGNGYIISWCIGHLVGPADAAQYDEKYKSWKLDTLPIIPDTWKYSIFNNKKKQFNIIKKLMNRKDIKSVVCATDAGREGELIFRFVYEMAWCNKPIMRLWLSSMEESAIRTGFDNLKHGEEYENLYQSALCRAKADWLIGINSTRLFSSLYGKTLNVGRVQTPTLAMLVDRQAKITNFSKEMYYKVRLKTGGFEATSESISDPQKAKQMQSDCMNQNAYCISLINERKTESAPKLFDLTSLQRESNKLFGLTAKQTLDIAQKLYESKLITYPRTDSKYITSDMANSVAKLSKSIAEQLNLTETQTNQINQVVNNAKVTDHHAIIPTQAFTTLASDKLSEIELKVILLIAYRFFTALCGKHVFDAITAVFECNKHIFTTRGKTTIDNGWRAIESQMKIKLGSKADTKDETASPPHITEGQEFNNPDIVVTAHATQPPKPFTEDTLLSAMEHAGADETDNDAERKGLGTPATRAATIEKLVTGGFVIRKGKQLIPSDVGTNLIKMLPQELTSPIMTAEWENKLLLVSKGSLNPNDFMDSIETMVKDIVSQNKMPKSEFKNTFRQ